MLFRFVRNAAMLAACIGCVLSSAVASAQSFAPAALALAPAGTVPGDLKVDVLDVIPDDALGVVIASDIENTWDTIEKVLEELQIPIGEVEEVGRAIEFVEQIDGWDSAGGHAIVFLPGEAGGPPKAVAIVPVTDYARFTESLEAEEGVGALARFEINGAASLVGRRDNYAVMSDENAQAAIEHVIKSKKSIAPACESLRPWFAKQQIAGVVLAPTIQMGCDAILKELDGEKLFQDAGTEEAKFVNLALPVVDGLRKLLEEIRVDMTHVGVGVRLDETVGLQINFQAVFKPDGKYAALAKQSPTLPPDYLLNLPADGNFYVAFAATGSDQAGEAIFDVLDEVLDEAAKQNDLPFDAAKLKAAMAGWRKSAAAVTLTATSQDASGEGFYDGTYEIVRVENAAAYVDAQEKMLRDALAAFDKLGDKMPAIRVERKSVFDLDAVSISIDMLDLMKKLGAENNDAQSEAMMKAMFGGEGTMTMYIAAANDDTVVMSYRDRDLRRVADAVKNNDRGLADDKLIKTTAALLPNDASVIGFLSFRGYLEQIRKMMLNVMAAQGNAFPLPIPPFPESPPIGFAATMRGNTIGVNIVVPMKLMEDTRDYVLQMKALFGGALR